MNKIALYVRVSTEGQNTGTQISILSEYAERRGFKIADVYSDVGISGSQDSRPELNRLMADARRRRFSTVLVFKFDRFARSTIHLLRALEEFRSLGVDFISYSEGIDTTTSTGKMVFIMISAIAEFERELIRDRVKAGIKRAMAQGKRLGRPKLKVESEKVRDLRSSGKSIRQIAKVLGISKSTVANLLRNSFQGVQNTSKNRV